MAFYRSEEMSLWHLMLHTETAFDCMVQLGILGMAQFNHIDEEGNLPNMWYTYDVRRCMELQHIIDFILSELEEANIELEFYPDVDEVYTPTEADIPNIEERLKQINNDLKLSSDNRSELKKRRHFLVEWYDVVTKADHILVMDSGTQLHYSDSEIMHILHDDSAQESTDHGTHLHYVAGTIDVDKFESFQMMLYRFFGFNVLVRHAEIEPRDSMGKQKSTAITKKKYVVVLMNITSVIRAKILKLCQAYHVTIYECPVSTNERHKYARQMEEEINYINLVLIENELLRSNVLNAANSELFIWKVNIKKSLMVYVLLNKLVTSEHEESKNFLHAELWIPDNEVENVREALRHGAYLSTSGSFVPLLLRVKRKTNQTAPTYFRLNKFTNGFQNLINAYGIADYREFNPAPYTIITFPFLFAVMFGDIGHGVILVILAYMLIRNETKIEENFRSSTKDSEIFKLLFYGRYIILLMGLFSIYTGFIYNDIFSFALNIFGSSWYAKYDEKAIIDADHSKIQLDPNSPNSYRGSPYYFGMDPIWNTSGEDSITTFNSLKMKLAVILGISQMMFGLILSAMNAKFFRKYEDLYLVVLPTIIFMVCIFCYLVFMIFLKWFLYGGHKQTPNNSACAPSILIRFIDMVLMKSSSDLPSGCSRDMFVGQRILEYALIAIAVCCIPILLAGKPIYLMRKQKIVRDEKDLKSREEIGRDTLIAVRKSLIYSIEYDDDTPIESKSFFKKPDTVSDIVDFEMSEIWVHSGIHCIECILGSISHTASYLRLWALSLAHGQLAHVLWSMVLKKSFTSGNNIFRPIFIVIAFIAWATFSLAILVAMEGLSAFLHTLRLHWVEFQSKFYSGSGEYFSPFYFEPSTRRS